MKTVFQLIEDNGLTLHGDIEHFAELVRDTEREACAKVCETLWDTATNGMATEEQSYGNDCAKVIRARGQA